MLTKEDLEQIAKLIEGSEKRLTSKIETVEKRLTSKIETVDQKVELLREDNKKDHAQIVEMLVESNDINGKEIKELEKRIDKLEEDQLSTHKN